MIQINGQRFTAQPKDIDMFGSHGSPVSESIRLDPKAGTGDPALPEVDRKKLAASLVSRPPDSNQKGAKKWSLGAPPTMETRRGRTTLNFELIS
jgi:hypothetical protein